MRSSELSPHREAPVDRTHRAVDEHLVRWERASLLTHDETERIRAFELAEADEAPAHVPLFAELLGYVGVALVLAAIVVLVGRFFDDLSWVARTALAGGAAAVFLLAGIPLRHRAEPALARLGAVLWTVSVAGVGLTVAFASIGDAEEPPPWMLLVTGLATTAYAALLLGLATSALLQAAVFVGTVLTLAGLGIELDDVGVRAADEPTLWASTGLVLGAAWAAGGRAGILRPTATAYALGALAAVYAPTFLMNEDVGAGVLVGVAVSAAVLIAAVWLRSVPALVLGAIGLFGYTTGCAVHFLRDSAGLPIVLLVSGLALVGVALLAVRLGRITTGEGPRDGPPYDAG
jgi:hypothetical protein